MTSLLEPLVMERGLHVVKTMILLEPFLHKTYNLIYLVEDRIRREEETEAEAFARKKRKERGGSSFLWRALLRASATVIFCCCYATIIFAVVGLLFLVSYIIMFSF